MPSTLSGLSSQLAAGLVPQGSRAAELLALGLVVYFPVLGFLGGYLLTRLFLAGAFRCREEELRRRI